MLRLSSTILRAAPCVQTRCAIRTRCRLSPLSQTAEPFASLAQVIKSILESSTARWIQRIARHDDATDRDDTEELTKEEEEEVFRPGSCQGPRNSLGRCCERTGHTSVLHIPAVLDCGSREQALKEDQSYEKYGGPRPPPAPASAPQILSINLPANFVVGTPYQMVRPGRMPRSIHPCSA